MQTSPKVLADPSCVLGKATARAAAALGINGKTLAQIIGLSEPTISRVLSEQRGIDPTSKEGELALLLVRVFRSLDALVGGSASKRMAWFSSYNKSLGGLPAELVQGAEGLVRTLAYLDGMRAPL